MASDIFIQQVNQNTARTGKVDINQDQGVIHFYTPDGLLKLAVGNTNVSLQGDNNIYGIVVYDSDGNPGFEVGHVYNTGNSTPLIVSLPTNAFLENIDSLIGLGTSQVMADPHFVVYRGTTNADVVPANLFPDGANWTSDGANDNCTINWWRDLGHSDGLNQVTFFRFYNDNPFTVNVIFIQQYRVSGVGLG